MYMFTTHSSPTDLTTLSLSLQIWFYTNAIFENAGIPVPQIQYTTVGTGAIEVIAGCVGVSKLSLDYCVSTTAASLAWFTRLKAALIGE
jgi:hypothetical protein